MKDQLFMLQPGFFEGAKGPLYCADSVAVEGLLSFVPALRQEIDVHYIDLPRPRAAVVALIGEDNQSIPVLVLAPSSVIKSADIAPKTFGTQRFLNDEQVIRAYLSSQYGAPISSASV
jgi:hypothetical protein